MGKGGVGALDKVKLMVGIEPEPAGLMDEFGEWATLSRKQRLIGFVACMAVGMILNLAAWFVIFMPIAFAVIFTFGNMISLMSTMFLQGPKKQFQNMTDKVRLGASVTYLTMMILTLVMALKFKTLIGTIVCCVIQWAALVWYGLSYIPFARTFVLKAVGLNG